MHRWNGGSDFPVVITIYGAAEKLAASQTSGGDAFLKPEEQVLFRRAVDKLEGPKIMGRIELPVKDDKKKPVASSSAAFEAEKKKKRKRINKDGSPVQNNQGGGGQKGSGQEALAE